MASPGVELREEEDNVDMNQVVDRDGSYIGGATVHGVKKRSSFARVRGEGSDDGNADEPPRKCELRLEDTLRNVIAYWILGLLNNFGYVVMLSAAEAIARGHAGAVLAADIVPTLLVKATAPFWVDSVPYPVRFILCTVFALAAFYTTAFAKVLGLKLLGVIFASISAGWGEVTALSLSSFYGRDVVVAWSSGTGFAGVLGAGWYLLFHDVIGLSPRLTLQIAGALPLVYLFTYLVVLQAPTATLPEGEDESSSQRLLDGSETEEGGVQADDSGWAPVMSGEPLSAREDLGSAAQENDGVLYAAESWDWPPLESMDGRYRARLGLSLWPYMVPLCVVYFAEYTINTGVNSTLSFESHGIDSDGFYVRASFAYQVGVFLSRSSASILPISILWPFPVLQMINLALFLAQALTDMLPAAWIVLLFVFWEGLLGGCVYVNAFRLIKERLRPDLREFAMGFASVADTLGIVAASGTSLWLEPALKRYRRRHSLG